MSKNQQSRAAKREAMRNALSRCVNTLGQLENAQHDIAGVSGSLRRALELVLPLWVGDRQLSAAELQDVLKNYRVIGTEATTFADSVETMFEGYVTLLRELGKLMEQACIEAEK